MAGLANTSRFMLGAATLMIGPQASLWDLQPSTHSLGLVKNIVVNSEPTFVDLTQGAKNTLVYSMMTGNPVKISAEVYEYTSRTLTYGLGLDGTGFAIGGGGPATTVQRAAGIDGSPTPTTSIPVADSTGFSVNDNVMVIPPNADDQMLVRTLSAVVGGGTPSLTVTHAINIDIATYTVQKVSLLKLGDTSSNNTFLSAKVAGQLADGTPAVMLFPKIKVTKGFNMAFNAEQYGNLPYEIQVYDLLPTDTFYSDFSTSKGGLYIP
jgi:hypothetical protein